MAHLTVGGLRTGCSHCVGAGSFSTLVRRESRSDPRDGCRGQQDHAQSGPDRCRQGHHGHRGVPHYHRTARPAEHPTPTKPPDRRSTRHRGGHIGRSPDGCGDAVIGINPATDSPQATSDLLHLLDDIRQRFEIPTQSCVLSHVTTTIGLIESGVPVDLVFQSIAGTEGAPIPVSE